MPRRPMTGGTIESVPGGAAGVPLSDPSSEAMVMDGGRPYDDGPTGPVEDG